MAEVAFSLIEFKSGIDLSAYACELADAQPDFSVLLSEASVPLELAERFRGSGVRYGVLITETWCPDSLHAVPLLVRLQETVPEFEIRVWKRSNDPELTLRIASDPSGTGLPAVPYIAFFNAEFCKMGNFRERPSSLTAYLEEESRKFRVQLRMQERARVRAETLAALLSATSALA